MISGRRGKPPNDAQPVSVPGGAVAGQDSTLVQASWPQHSVPAPAPPMWTSTRPYSDPNTLPFQTAPVDAMPGSRRSSISEAGPDALAALHPAAILERYRDVESVQRALRRAGLESSNLIFAVDFTSSNTEAGKYSFGGRSLHCTTGPQLNPYEEAIQIMGNTLSPFDNDNLLPCYGFGDESTSAYNVFSFTEGDRPLEGFEQVLARYRQLVPHVKLAGPTSFAPAIQQAMKIVMQSDCEYHILVIIADGQVTRGSDTPDNELSIFEELTIDAITEASNLPLSIIMVGVGDGPWEMMEEFDQRLPKRKFDNFRFVNFTSIMATTRGAPPAQREAIFALSALQEIPAQYMFITQNNLLNIRDRDWGVLPTAMPPPRVAHTAPEVRPVPVQHNTGPLGGMMSFERPVSSMPYPAPVRRHPPAVVPSGDVGAPRYPVPLTPADIRHSNLTSSTGQPDDGQGRLVQEMRDVTLVAPAPPVTSPGPVTAPNPWNVPLHDGQQPPGGLPPLAIRAPWEAALTAPTGKRPETPPSPPRVSPETPPTDNVGDIGAGFAVEEDDEDPDMKPEFLCPITMAIMENPVFAEDGHSYEEAQIKAWLAKKLTSPKTGAELPSNRLIPNHGLRALIQDYKEKKKQAQKQQLQPDGLVQPAAAASVLL